MTRIMLLDYDTQAAEPGCRGLEANGFLLATGYLVNHSCEQ